MYGYTRLQFKANIYLLSTYSCVVNCSWLNHAKTNLDDAEWGKRLQAQTVANFYLAFEQNLAIVPVLNKCDMISADPNQVADQMQQVGARQAQIRTCRGLTTYDLRILKY